MVRGTNSQEESKRNLYSDIYLLEDEIKKIKLEIEEINMKIIEECIEKNGKHDFEREREAGLYGESYFVCKQCGYES
jgi:hypothetical protein